MRTTEKRTYAVAGIAAIATFAVYLASLQNDFVAEWDDGEYVLNNPHLRSLDLAFLRWAFFDFYASNWHPLTWISHAVDYAIWGLKPFGHHLTNNILHAANAFIVVLFIRRLLEAAQAATTDSGAPPLLDERGMLIAGGIGGLLFGLHPVHVESAAWIAERKDLLCGLFFLLSVITYTKYAAGQRSKARGMPSKGEGGHGGVGRAFFTNKHYLAALVFFFLALMSKPMAVSLPVVLLIIDWYPFQRFDRGPAWRIVVIEKLPFIAGSLVSSVLTVLAQASGGAIVETRVVPLSSRLLVAAQSLIAYLGKIVAPVGLLPFYPYPSHVSLLSPRFLVPLIAVIGTTVWCIMISRKRKLWLSTWGYYVVTLLPVLGIVQVGSQSMADRYTYLPSIAPFLIVAVGAAWGLTRLPAAHRSGTRTVVLAAGAATFVLVSLTYLTVQQVRIWENGYTLWSHVIEHEPRNVPLAYTNLGSVYQKRGQLQDAMANFDRAIALDPNDYMAYINRGVIFDKVGAFGTALESFNTAVALNPSEFTAYYNRGITYDKMGRTAEAIRDFERAVILKPNEYRAHNNLGILYTKSGQYDRAAASFHHAIAIDPYNAITYTNRGLAYSYGGDFSRALEDFSKAILLDQQNGSAYFHRGDVYYKSGNRERALSDFQQGCSLGNPDACAAMQALQTMPTTHLRH
jgi:Tfp pilus assembly protein PilF